MNKRKFLNKNNVILIIVLFLIIIIINVIGLLIIENNVNKNLENKNIETKTDYTIKYNSYSFTIPLTLQHEINNSDFLISNKVNNWTASLNIISNDYETLYKNREKIEKNLSDKQIEISNILERTYAGTTYITIEITYGSESALLAISNLSGGNSIMFIIQNEENDYDYDVLVELSPVVKSASYFGESNNQVTNNFNKQDIIDSLMDNK